jgi:nucleotide-binding universal stress UspA family protein
MFDGHRLNIKRIVCPVDVSPDSAKAISYAVALAPRYKAGLFVLHCCASGIDTGPTDRHGPGQFIETLKREYATSSSRPEIEWEPLKTTEPDLEIARKAAALHADLIVMRSRRQAYGALVGSVAESVCRIAPCPTLVTHARQREWPVGSSKSLDLRRVLVAYDFSSDSEVALSYGLSFAEQYGAELHVLHVVPSRPRETSLEFTPLPLASETSSGKAVAALKIAVPHNEVGGGLVRYAVREGQPYREVLSYAEDQAIDLICMGASGTGFGMHALFGSNSDRVLRQAPCPMARRRRV